MKRHIGVALLLAALPLAGGATGKLGSGRCAQGSFGELRCDFTAKQEGVPAATAGTLGSLRRVQLCSTPASARPGTRDYRRCMRPLYATAAASTHDLQ